MPKLQGIDVSHFQGLVDWPAVARAKKVFAFIKASEGATYTDPLYARNIAAAQAAGLLAGPYHYLRGGVNAKEQVDHFLSVVGPWEKGRLQPAIDVEREGNEGITNDVMIKTLRDVLILLQQATGQNPLIYSYPWYWSHNMSGTNQFSTRYPLWISNFAQNTPTLIGGWPFWTFWQYSTSGKCAGVSGACDLDYFNGSLAQLRKFAGY